MSLKQKIVLLVFILVGTVIQVMPVIKSGLNYSFGTGYWGANGHDGIWHLSLINNIHNPLSIDMPVFAGEKLKNYHPLFDIFLSILSRTFHLSSQNLLFQIFPIISSIILLSLSFYLGFLITTSFSGGIFLLLLNTLANSFGWIVSLFRFGNFNGETIFWAMQSPSNQINPPYTLSLIFLLILLIIIYRHPLQSKLNFFEATTVFLILTLLPVTKAYSAIIGFSIFGLFALRELFSNKKIQYLFILFLSLVSAVYLFTRYNSQSGGLFVFQPLWFVNSMIESPDRVFIPFLANMRYTLEAANRLGPKLIAVYLSTIALFYIGNYSWRLLVITKFKQKLDLFHFTLILNIIFLSLVPLFFIQKGTSWNTIQFLYYALFLTNIFFAAYLNQIFATLKGKLFTFIIFATYLIGLYGSLPNYLGTIPPAAISPAETEALNFLRQQPTGTILTVPYDAFLKKSFASTPIPLYAYETTAYVSAFTQHPVFFEDEMNLQNSEFNVSTRRHQSLTFFSQKNVFQDRGFLINNQISYIYLTGLQTSLYNLNTKDLYLTQIFKNDDSLIYQVQR